jgi:predicted metal-dependent hydrolase
MQLSFGFETSVADERVPRPESIEFLRHPRARRYVIRVRDDGSVRVTIPRWGSKREAERFAGREHAWIEKQRARAARRRQLSPAEAGFGLAGEGIAAVDCPTEATGADAAALRERARQLLPARLLELAARHGLAVSRVSIRNQKSRWGSCSRAAHICLNWRLILVPDFVRDYVMIHELMHLKRMDHSPRFWKLVAAAYPEYESARRWLRTAQP